jgi:membrane-associated protease RseP (regulator of RpoE activity)
VVLLVITYFRVAGWKQKDHPMLYNALHIGDQLVSVAGILVQSANDAQRLIRGAPSLYVRQKWSLY